MCDSGSECEVHAGSGDISSCEFASRDVLTVRVKTGKMLNLCITSVTFNIVIPSGLTDALNKQRTGILEPLYLCMSL